MLWLYEPVKTLLSHPCSFLANAVELSVLFQDLIQEKIVMLLFFSPDNKYLASGQVINFQE